jgi:hypothetical protein
MDMDEWDDLHDGVVDLDGGDYATGDPALDQLGFTSPTRRGENLGGFTSHDDEVVERNRARREQRRRAVQANIEASKQRVEQRQHEKRVALSFPQPAPVAPDLAPHVSQAIAEGMAGRDLGWWRVDVDAYGRAVWTRVAQPGDGPRMTVEQQTGGIRQFGHPVEQTQPTPGTQVW